jgi:Zn-finger nucleic acid-binding protein
MPLLVSPIDGKTPMQQIVRDGIEIDRCPVSGGVWLDKGELEKLLNAMTKAHLDDRDEYANYQRENYSSKNNYQRPPSSDYRHYHKKDDDYDDYYKRKYSKKSKVKSFLDIFDF